MEKIFVTKSSMPEFDEYTNMIKKIWDTHWLTNMGEFHNELEKELEDYLEVENVSLFTNGHMALELLIQAMDLKGEVITTPFTFASTTHAIVRNGLKPVFCDIEPDTYTIDTDKIEDLITEKTSAILPVHVYGNVCNVEKIEEIAKKHNLKVIYDAAHAFGVKYKGKGIVNFGDASMLSFHATKVFNTIEGGAACFNNNIYLKNKLYSLKNFGIRSEEEVDGVGANAKMNEFQAAMGLCNLKHINENIEKRKLVVERYRENLSEINGIKYLEPQKDVVSNYAYFPITVDENMYGYTRDYVYDELKKENIFTRKYFYPIANEFKCYKNIYDSKTTPNALRISKQILSLPLYADLSISSVDRICKLIKNIKV